ncbi:MAG: permease-like cell division protein FtsX [Ruminococcus sp.]|nr:permease-like cell division protein FtsX [Ruminococcus sp.]MCD7799755.1 permease-like cell division protein FtsX [Ruminococcus sp.]
MTLSNLLYLISQGLNNIRKNLMMTFASICVISVSLLLIGFSTLFVMNVNKLIGGIEDTNEIEAFLNDDMTQADIDELGEKLLSIDNVESVTLYSKEEALQSYIESMSGFEEVFESLGNDNPLPNTYRIKVVDTSKLSQTVAEINSLNYIYKVKAPYDLANMLTQLKRTISIISTVLFIALVVVCMIIISNTTKASVLLRKKEINIMKYVGATNIFIRVPFFIEGFTTGLIGGMLALVITWFGYNSLLEAITMDMSLWNIIGVGGFINLSDILLKVIVFYLAIGCIIGAFGSVLSTRKHIKV